MNIYKTAHMDSKTKTLTVLILLLLILVPVSQLLLFSDHTVYLVVIFIILYGIIIISYGMVPKKITVSDGQITVRTMFGSTAIPVNEIEEIARTASVNNLRTFGVGGLFGYFGYFNGDDRWYVTNVHKKVKMKLRSGKVLVLSPEEPEIFIHDVQEQIK